MDVGSPVRDERAVEQAVTSTAELPAPPAVLAAIAREESTARLAAVGLAVLGAALAGVLVWSLVLQVGDALHGSAGWDPGRLAFGALMTLVIAGIPGLRALEKWHRAADASRDAREAVYLETTGPVYLERQDNGEGVWSWWLMVGDRHFGIGKALYDRLGQQLPYGRVAVVAHSKRTGRLLGVRQAAADGGAALTDLPVRLNL